MQASLTYTPETNTVTVTDTAPPGGLTYYRLVQLVDGARKLLTAVFVGTGVSWKPGSDGAYLLSLQLVTPPTNFGLFTVVTESEPVSHLQLLGSLKREEGLYAEAVADCHPDFRKVLCERYRRQKAIAAYQSCNLLVADKHLRATPGCC